MQMIQSSCRPQEGFNLHLPCQSHTPYYCRPACSLHDDRPSKDIPIRLKYTESDEDEEERNMSTTLPIACVESYINPSLPIGTSLSLDDTVPALHLLPTHTLSKLKNVGATRVKSLRALGQSKQVLSHIPISANASTCTRFNDALFAGIQLIMDKFAAMAILPADGQEAARELQRCVSKMKFVGGVVGYKPNGIGGASMGDDLEPLWDVASRYRVPIMLRDMWPVGAEVCLYNFRTLSNKC